MKRILTNLLLASVVILTSCSKEDDLLTPVNPTNTVQINDTTTYTVTGGDTIALCPWEPGYTPDEPLTNALNLEGNKYNVTYSSFYLRNRFPICAIPTDTLIFEENINSGIEEVYFSNQGDGYLHTRTYPRDHESPMYNVSIINAPWYLDQPIDSYTIENNKILVNILQHDSFGNPIKYSATFNVVENTGTKLVIENKQIWFDEPNPNIGYLGTDCERTVRLELEKVN
jgi:hypothetical protein